jgi:hypothetical protein
VKETEVIVSQLIKPREAAPEVLDFADEALDEVTFFVKFFVVLALLLAVTTRRNHRFGTHRGNENENALSVVSSVG